MGTGDYRSTCLTVKRPDGSCGCDLRYKSHSIRSGKYDLPGLPAVYDTAEQCTSQTLEIELEDICGGLSVTLLYGVFPELDVITRSAVVKTPEPVTFSWKPYRAHAWISWAESMT